MALVIWTGADSATLKAVLGPVMTTYMVEHRVVQDMEALPAVVDGDVVLACGSKALALLQKAGMAPKNRTISSLRERPIAYKGSWMFLTYDPNIIQRDYARLPEIQWDTQLAIRMHETGTTKPKIGQYRYVESLHELIERIDEKYEETKKPVEVACDLETKSLDPYDPEAWIIAASFTVDEGKSDVLYFERGEKPIKPPVGKRMEDLTYWEGLWVQLNWVLTTRKVSLRGANFKYDSTWIALKWGIECTNHKFDTLLVGSLLDENRSNSLKLHAKIMTTMGGYEDDMDNYDFSCLEKVPKDEMLNYVGGDTDATYRVAKVMKRDLCKDKRLANFYTKLLHPASKAFERLERTGVLVDVEYFHQLKAELEAEIVRLQQEMLACMPHKMRIKYKDDISASMEDGKSPFKPKILSEFLFTPNGLNLKPKVFTEKTKTPSTSMDHLMMFEDDPVAAQFISRFRELGSASKTLSTFVIGFLKHLRSDGRFHPTYMLHRGDYESDDSGTTTGRTSAKSPAIQTLPKHSKWAKKLRRAYIAPPGMSILQADFSQGELRIAAVVANEPTMIHAYQSGADLHAITAAQLNGYTFEEFMALPEDVREELRYGGKAGNFGLCLAKGSRVLIWDGHESRTIPIETVQPHHMVWDGNEWVHHEGVVCQGVKEVMTWDGLTATPDHEVWATTGEKMSLAEAAMRGVSLLNSAIGHIPLSVPVAYLSRHATPRAINCTEPLTSRAINCTSHPTYRVEVYDLINAGPRHRFTCEGKLVSNCYGMQHKGFMEYAYTTYGVKMTEEEAFQKREAFFALYGRLLEWHEEYKRLAHQWGFVRSPLGRIRHLPHINSKDRDMVAKAERQAINSPIQATLSDMMQLAMVHIMREYGDAVDMFMMTHDSLALYVPEDDAVEWAKRVKGIMENLPLKEDFGWDSPLKFIADAEVGATMADLKKLKGI